MFLSATLRRNPQLVEAALRLHQAGALPPDCYVIDLDTVEANAQAIAAHAGRVGIRPYFVVKQVGRNPLVIDAIAAHIPNAAAIDLADARQLWRRNVGIGNVGHLVQPPQRAVNEVVGWSPEHVTVFSLDKAAAVAAAAARIGVIQRLFVRVAEPGDCFFPGQHGGVPLAGLPSFVAAVQQMDGAEVAGVTSFPCLLFDQATGRFAPTANLDTLRRARDLLDRCGIAEPTINAPSGTCTATLRMLAAAGATHAEPGHALTGTTPLHANNDDQPERPAYLYVSEVSHLLPDGRVAVFGGGFYPRAQISTALVTRSGPSDGQRLNVEPAPADNIDYYRLLCAPDDPKSVRPGDSALLAFRTQMFVTRSTIACLRDVGTGRERITGLFDSSGRSLPWAAP